MNCKICKEKLYLVPILVGDNFEDIYVHNIKSKEVIQGLVENDNSFWKEFKQKIGDINEMSK